MKYVVAAGNEFNYCSEANDKIVKASGGRSRMSQEALSAIQFKIVKEGEDCSDMPSEALALYVSRGWVVDTNAPATVVEEVAPEVVSTEPVLSEDENTLEAELEEVNPNG